MENPFYFDIYQTVEADAHTRGYEVILANTVYGAEQLVTSIHLMIGCTWRGWRSSCRK
jgi:DNA-binding LacI/PurR family transcriptional regulator